MSRFAQMYGMEYVGMASTANEAKVLAGKIGSEVIVILQTWLPESGSHQILYTVRYSCSRVSFLMRLTHEKILEYPYSIIIPALANASLAGKYL